HSNGVTWEQSINPADRMRRPYEIKTTGVATGNWSTGTYAYDGAGNIQRIDGQRFQYDGLSRLVLGQVAVDGQMRTQTVSYDDYANITQLVTHGTTRSTPINASTNRMTGASYDAAGNLTDVVLGGETFKYTYDAASMMKYLQSTSGIAKVFLYDANDERVVTFDCPLDSCGLDTAQETWTLRRLDGKVLRAYLRPGGGKWDWSIDYIYRHSGALLAAIEGAEVASEKIHQAHLDHLGSPRQITNKNAREVASHRYFPFGEDASDADQDTLAMKYTGHESDTNANNATGNLYYMHARFCSPGIGRFLSSDPITQTGRSALRPQLWNRYQYALNNPMSYTDPTGRVVHVAMVTPEKLEQFLDALRRLTGLELSVVDGVLVSKGQHMDENGNPLGSKTARRDILGAISSKRVLWAMGSSNNDAVSLARRRGAVIDLDFADFLQVDTGENNPFTFDVGIVFLHELSHWAGTRDPSRYILEKTPHLMGPTVRHVNLIRAEMGYEERLQYKATFSEGRHYIPFSKGPIYVPEGVN
ncbi:MAG: RHS repeat-associated core domain-containing protein, partial [bacterium]|nr:RHS repeat-associated core domain-containing protein [bacterium]